MKLFTRTTVALAAITAIGVATPQMARADITPGNTSPVTSGPVAGVWTYQYEVVLGNAENVQSGDFFILYDFGPSVNPVTIALLNNAGWSVSTALSTTGAAGTSPVDNPGVLDYKFTYTGATILGPTTGTVSLGTVTLTSTGAPSATAVFHNWDGRGTDISTGLPNGNLTSVIVPVLTPEPASFVLLGTGMLES